MTPDEFYQRLNNPMTVLGANMMAGFDPRGMGLGGLGRGVLNTIAHQRSNEEYDRQRQMADLQHEELTMRLGQARRATQNREGLQSLMADPGFLALPMDQRIGQMAQFMGPDIAKSMVESAYRKPTGPQTQVAKLNADLQAGQITRPQYDAEMARLNAQGRNVVPLEGGGAAVYDRIKGTVTYTLPSGAQKTVRAGQGGPGGYGMPQAPGGYGPPQVPAGAAVAPQAPAGAPIAPYPMPQGTPEEVAPQQYPDEFDIQARVAAINAMPTDARTVFTASEELIDMLPRVIEQVEQNPDAFGFKYGATEFLPDDWQGGMASKWYKHWQGKGLTDPQIATRAAVFRQASEIIKRISGVSVSPTEKARVEEFTLSATDPHTKVLSKLRDALEFARDKRDSYAYRYNVQSIPDRRPNAGSARPNEGWKRTQGGSSWRERGQ